MEIRANRARRKSGVMGNFRHIQAQIEHACQAENFCRTDLAHFFIVQETSLRFSHVITRGVN